MKKFVLTGGPCSGKTTGLHYLHEKLSDFGVSLVTMPEAATLVINAGSIKPPSLPREKYLQFEELLIRTQMEFEDKVLPKVLKIKGGQNQLMVCDRGIMDIVAYVDPKGLKKIFKNLRLDKVSARDKRYDAVFHLVSVACDKPEYYNLDNTARIETVKEAIVSDNKTKNAWLGHPHLVVIDNSTSFKKKMKRLLNAVRKALGIPVAIETERKFIVTGNAKIPVPHQEILITQFYSRRGEDKIRFRKRSQENSSHVYYRTHKAPTDSEMSQYETERQISKKEYLRALPFRDPSRDIIEKKRRCFLYKNQYFEFDIFLKPSRLRGMKILEIELTEENDKVTIPPWFGEIMEVTGDKAFSNSQLAKRP